MNGWGKLKGTVRFINGRVVGYVEGTEYSLEGNELYQAAFNGSARLGPLELDEPLRTHLPSSIRFRRSVIEPAVLLTWSVDSGLRATRVVRDRGAYVNVPADDNHVVVSDGWHLL